MPGPMDLTGPGGMAGGMAGGPMQAAGRMASPETLQRPSPGNVDSRSIISSPLADQISGPMMQQQLLAKESRLIQGVVMPILMQIANRKKEVDPKGSADMFKMIADLVKTVPPVQMPPTSPGGMARAAQGLPQVGSPPAQGGGPPPPAGPAGPPLSGPMSGM